MQLLTLTALFTTILTGVMAHPQQRAPEPKKELSWVRSLPLSPRHITSHISSLYLYSFADMDVCTNRDDVGCTELRLLRTTLLLWKREEFALLRGEFSRIPFSRSSLHLPLFVRCLLIPR